LLLNMHLSRNQRARRRPKPFTETSAGAARGHGPGDIRIRFLGTSSGATKRPDTDLTRPFANAPLYESEPAAYSAVSQ